MHRTEPAPETDVDWFKDAIIYQLHVKSFFDSNGDGIGDFRGLGQRLDYLHDLGITAIWLLPFYPSPLRDDGYDIADYRDINSSYGTISDFKAFLREAHRRDLKVITELVINHTSDQHAWFQRARQATKSSAARDFYIWSDTPDGYRDARIIFQDFETSNWSWDPVAQQYFWHRFYSHQPDLNFANPRVRAAVKSALDFWMSMGVDGMRLDAIPYLFEREGTNCENLPETHEFLQELRAHLDQRYQGRMLLGEANQWPEDAVAYFGDGNECHMAFHFPLMPRLFMAVQSEDRFPVVDILQQTPPIPDSCQWAIFLRNHDELTLEMVTDEERDYMYRSYATDPQMRVNLGIRRRLSPLLGGNRNKIQLLNGILFSMPGTPIIYYGDELGMGDNVYLGDRDGVRTPMQWSGDRNAGFSTANPHKLYLPVIIDPEYHYEYVNVESQQNNPNWLLWWMKRLIALRNQHRAFSRGAMEFLPSDNHRVLTYVRTFEDERILVVANLSRFSQSVELDLSAFAGTIPLELFGHSEFPRIGETPYPLSVGPHAFYWFQLTPQRAGTTLLPAAGPPELTVRGTSDRALRISTGRSPLDRILPAVISSRRWFGARARRLRSASLTDVLPIAGRSSTSTTAHLLIVEVEYFEGDPDVYSIPIHYIPAEHFGGDAGSVLARIHSGDGEGLFVDGASDETVHGELLDLIRRRRVLKGRGSLAGSRFRAFRAFAEVTAGDVSSRPFRGEQSNSSIVYGNSLILKLYRRLHKGTNPDLELSRYLSEVRGFPHVPRTAGSLEYRSGSGESTTAGILQELVENSGDAWELAVREAGLFLERGLNGELADLSPLLAGGEPRAEHQEAHEATRSSIGSFLDAAALLGRRTGELHLALAAPSSDPAFAPEPFSKLYQRSLYQSIRSDIQRTVQSLRNAAPRLTESLRAEVDTLLDHERSMLETVGALLEDRISGQRIRIHGDYHLGQVLYTGRDFVIIDFEGEPARPLSERKIKRSPLRDVAGMLRSFHYAAFTHIVRPETSGFLRSEDTAAVEPWAEHWYRWTSHSFLEAYLETVQGAGLLPDDPLHVRLLLDSLLLQKAAYEITYELNSRPEWLGIPVRGAVDLMSSPSAAELLDG